MGNDHNGHFDFVLPMADNKDFQANCKLIASAPELLEALKNALQQLYSTDDDCGHPVELFQQIECAIEKATS